jgi:predicted ABC-type ATPase
VPCDQQAIIAGGLGGAGKTTILKEYANIDLSNYLVVNPDDIKEQMARRGMIPEISGLSPMEASDLAHEESSYIAKRLAMRAAAEGKNLIWDITMSSEDSTKERINNLRSSGYNHIEGLFVDISIETSVRRIDARHREGHDMYRAGLGLGGRFVPEEVSRDQEDPEWGSQNRRTFERVKRSLDTWSVYDNSLDGRSPIRIESNSN